jgi:hypothetical protein
MVPIAAIHKRSRPNGAHALLPVSPDQIYRKSDAPGRGRGAKGQSRPERLPTHPLL